MRSIPTRPLIAARCRGWLGPASLALVAMAACSSPAATANRNRSAPAAAAVTSAPAPTPPTSGPPPPAAAPAAQAPTSQPPAAPPSGSMTAPAPAAPTTPVDVDPVLKARVDAYWAARMKMNLAVAYTFYDATFRAAYSEDKFLQNFQRLLRFRPSTSASSGSR